MATRTETPVRDVRLVASAAGRTRLRSPGLRGRGDLAEGVEQHLTGLEGVRAASVHERTGGVVVWHDPQRVSGAQLVEVLGGLDLAASDHVRRSVPEAPTGEVARLVVGGAVLGVLALRRFVLRRPPLLSTGAANAAAGVAIFTGYPFLRGALRSLVGRQSTGTDALVTAATIASLALRENVVALTVLWLLNIGEYLQALTLRRTRRAIEDLLSVGEDRVWLVIGENDVEVEVPLERVEVGDTVAVYAHRKIPVDGVVSAGEAVVDQAAVTGESMPVYAASGAHVYAGTILVQGSLRVCATGVGRETAVGRIIERVESAQADRAPIETLATRFSRRFVPVSFALAGVTYLLTRDARRSMTMLLIACPCAAGLSTPTAISAAIGNGARRGMLIKGGTHLEGAGNISAAIFDKTGTLTVGRPLVTNVVALDQSYAPESVLALAASSEIHARHPLAQAVVRHTEEQHIEIPIHEECEVVLGMGMRADLQGNRLLVGSPRLMREYHVDVEEEATGWVARLRDAGEIVLCVAYNERLIGVIGVTDAVRPDAPDVLERLHALGIHRVVMLTGDSPETARTVAAALGVTDYRAEALPETKLEVVDALRREGHTVAVVGDGTNDAPALAQADIGIAMGASGSDVALESADIALASNDLMAVADVVSLGRQTLRVVRQNYGLAIGVNTVGLLVGALGTLNPVLAAVLHNASSVAVVVNSSRLVRYGQNGQFPAHPHGPPRR